MSRRGGNYGLAVGGRTAEPAPKHARSLSGPPELAKTWSRVCGVIRGQIKKENADLLLRDLVLESVEPGAVVVVSLDPYVLDLARGPYAAHLAAAFATVLGREVQVDLEERAHDEPGAGEPAAQARSSAISEPSAPPAHDRRPTHRLAYTISPFAQVSPLPARSGLTAWAAHQGHTRLEASAPDGLPHGGLGRRLLIHLISSVVRSGLITPGAGGVPAAPRPVKIADSVSDLVRALGGRHASGGAAGARAAALGQLHLALATTWQLDEGGKASSLRLFTEAEAEIKPRRPIYLTPTVELLALARQRLVPLIVEAVNGFGRDCTALDLYTWATWRNHPHQHRGAGDIAISLESMGEQMGRLWQSVSAWGSRLARALEVVAAVYVDLALTLRRERGFVRRALRLRLTRPHVDASVRVGIPSTAAAPPGT